MTSLELTDKEKAVFLEWLQQREQAVLDEISLLKTLRVKLEAADKIEATPKSGFSKTTSLPAQVQSSEKTVFSWVSVIKKELAHFSHPVPSGEIVKRLLQKQAFSEKGKRFITKAVTSKLWLLQERGEVSKTRENGKYVYALKK